MQNNIILNTDSYKVSHYLQYPEGTKHVFSYIESRGGEYDATVFFGLQGFIKKYLLTPITQNDIDVAEVLMQAHGLPFNRKGWEHILNVHGGFLPVKIWAAPEGSIIPTKNILVGIMNTDPEVPWIVSHLETAMLRAVWYPTTVATQSRAIKEVIQSYLEVTGDPSLIDFKLHDFGARGASSEETAAIGGAAHLVNFKGTDTISGLLYAMDNYGAGMPGFSIPAAEHSTITSWGRENERQAYENMLDKFAKPGAIVAVVSDSYNVFNAVENIWGEELKEKIISSGGTLVIRPDSGDPVMVNLQLISILGQKFGYTVNEKGYKVLPSYVRLIQGDGITEETVGDILATFQENGWSSDNIAFGMGGKLLQGITRDTQKFAMKCSAIFINGEWRDVYKDPVTDPGKTSKKGLLWLFKDSEGKYYTCDPQPLAGAFSALNKVYENGKLQYEQNFEQVRAIAESGGKVLN